ncbi:MAG: SDR family oxidoreductase [Acidimicrobiales bacterium]|nr:SDR family oxidoreductase [Acidimicrobiales bacterium]
MADPRPPLPWSSALVTGASSGIGEALARRLAAAGIGRLVLVARRADRLLALARELTRRHGTEVEVLVADLADPGDRGVVERLLADPTRCPDLLVNNAGVNLAGDVADRPADDWERVVELNVVALVRLTRVALPVLVERGRGAVCNVSSLATYQPAPGVAVYGATKSFVTSFGEALHEELRGTGVTVTTVCPGFVRTELAPNLGDPDYRAAPRFAWMSADAVADAALEATARGRALCVPGAGYKLAVGLTTPLPRNAKRWLMGRASGIGARLGRSL